MERTQIYLTVRERQALRLIAQRLGTTQSEVIRTAVDRFIERESADDKVGLLRRGAGIWQHRDDLPDFTAPRRELDRAT
jgi:hypothetical protein